MSPSDKPSRPRRGLARRLLRWTAWTLGGLLLLLGALVGFLETGLGKRTLAGLIEDLASTPDQQLKVTDLGGSLFGRVTLGGVTLSDGEGAWLTATGVTLDWSPTALLSGELKVELLRVEDLALLRAPPPGASAPAEPDSGPALPALPFAVALDRLALDHISLGAPLLGEAAELSLTAQATLAENRLSATLALKRLDGTPGAIDLAADWQPALDRLALDLKASEPRGGLMARLAELPGLPAVDLALTGEGPLSAWTGQLTLALDGAPVADLTLTADGRERRSLLLTGRVASSSLLPAEAQAWTAGGLTLDAAAALDGEILSIGHLAVESDAVSIALSGSAALAQETADLSATVVLKDPAALTGAVPELALGAATVELTAKGPFAAPQVTAKVAVRDLAVPDFAAGEVALDLAGTPLGAAAIERDGYRLTLTAQVTAPLLDEPTLQPWPYGDLALDGTVTLTPALRLGIEQAHVTGQEFDLRASGDLDLDTVAGALKVALKARTPVIQDALAVPLGLDLTGDVTLGADSAVAVSLAAGITGAEALPGELGSLLGSDVRLAGGVAIAANGDLAFDRVQVTAKGATVTLDGGYGAAGVDLTWQAAVADLAGALAPFGIAAAGAANLDGSLAGGSLDDMTLLANLDGKALVYQDVALGDLSGSIAVAGLPAAPTGSVTLDAPGTAYGPLALTAEVEALDAGGFRVAPLSLSWGQALALKGELQSSSAGLPLTGQLSGTLSQSPLLDQLGIPLTGGGKIALALTAPEGRQDAKVTLALGPGSLAGVTHGGGSVNATASDLLGSPVLAADATFAGVTADPARLNKVTVTAKGPLDRLQVTLATAGEMEGKLELSLAATLSQSNGGIAIALQPFKATVADLPIALAEPASVRVDGGAIRLQGVTLAVAGGSVGLDATLGGGAPSLDLKVAGLDLAALEPFYDQVVPQGRVDLTLSLKGSGRGARGQLSLAAANLALRQRGLSVGPALDIKAEGTLAEGRFDLGTTVNGDFGRDLVLQLALPLQVALDRYAVTLPEDGALAGRAQWQGEVAPLVDFLPFDSQVLRGTLALDVTLGGTLGQPVVQGSVAMTKGHYENLLSGTVLENLTLEASGLGLQMAVEATASDGAQGRMTLQGQVDFAAPGGVAADMTLALKSFALMQRDDLFARLDGSLKLADAPAGGLLLSGKLTGDRIDLDIGADLPPSVATLDVVILQDGKPVNPPRPKQPEDQAGTAVAPFAIALDLAIDLPRRVFVHGSGLESEWAGALQVGGTTAAPVITGSLSPQRGLFSLLGSEFDLGSGAITFDGGPDLDPRLDLRATYTSSRIAATVNIGGRASQPEITLTSVPALPQEEILSRVLFDRGTGQITPLEAVQLAEAAAILSGATGSNKTIVDRLKQSFGLDVLRLEGGDSNGDVSATVGQYISKGIFLGVTQGTTPGSTAAKVEVEVSPEIVIEGEVGATSKVGVRWQWDY